MFHRMLLLMAFLLAPLADAASPVPAETRQIIVGIARDWDDSHVALQRYERKGKAWQPVGTPWNGRLGRSGLVWGRGLHPVPENAKLKVEGDGRAPAGVFSLGHAYGLYRPDQVARKHGMVYEQIGPRDLWVEDPTSPYYNRHLKLPHAEPRTAWEKKQQMKLNDPAHNLKLFVNHNAPPNVVLNGGSAIFFHVWRSNGTRPTTGCTTMPEWRLREMIAWLDPQARPVYILLPRAEYARLRGPWKLP